MNNTSPGSKHSIPQASDQATSLANSLSNVNIGKSKETESRQAENEPSAPRPKLTANDFEWGESIGEGSYSRVSN